MAVFAGCGSCLGIFFVQTFFLVKSLMAPFAVGVHGFDLIFFNFLFFGKFLALDLFDALMALYAALNIVALFEESQGFPLVVVMTVAAGSAVLFSMLLVMELNKPLFMGLILLGVNFKSVLELGSGHDRAGSEDKGRTHNE